MSTVDRNRKLALLVVGSLLLCFAYRPLITVGRRYGVESGIEYWLMAPNNQAPLVILLLSGWLAYRRWGRLSALSARRSPAWCIALAFGLGVSTASWSFFVHAEDLLAISLIASLSGLILLQWGVPGLRVMWVPLAFLLFCMPIPGPLVVGALWELRLWTAEYTGWIFYMLGSPAFVSGDQIIRATQSFQVIEGCSGLRSIETLTMLVVLLIDLFQRTGWQAAILLVAAPLTAFAMNGLRVLTLILNPASEIVAIHSLQGIAILLLGLLFVYALDAALQQLRRHRPVATIATAGRSATATGPAPRGLAGLAAVGLAMAAIALWMPVWSPERLPVADLERLLAEALGEDAEFEERDEDVYFHGRMRFRRSVHRVYPGKQRPVEVFVGTGDRQDRQTSILSRITKVPGSGWLVRESSIIELDGRLAEASLIEKGLDRRLSYRWYEGSCSLLAETLRSFLGIDRSPFATGRPILIARLDTAVSSAEPAVRERAERRLESLFSLLEPALKDLVQGHDWDEPADPES